MSTKVGVRYVVTLPNTERVKLKAFYWEIIDDRLKFENEEGRLIAVFHAWVAFWVEMEVTKV